MGLAVREFKVSEKKKNHKKRNVYLCVLCLLTVCFWVCFAVCASNNEEIEKYNSQIEDINDKYERVASENGEYTEILSQGNSKDYIEKIAREVYGYCRPGEKVFYASSN